LLVAPNFEQELLEIASLEHFPIEFVEIGRYAHEESTFVIVNRMEAPEVKVGSVIGSAQYDWAWYESDVVRSEIELKIAKSLYDKLISLTEKNGWKISPKFNKWYIAFKYGDRNRNPFTLEFKHKGKVAIVCQYLYDESKPPITGNIEWKWDKVWEYWYTEIEKPDFDLAQIESALAESYKRGIAA
jgi:rubredoxin